MRVVILLPGISRGPVGGYKIVFEYANRLVTDNYDVTIAYAGIIWKEFRRKSLRFQLGFLKSCILGTRKISSRMWFPLDKKIREIFPFTLRYNTRIDADIYIATACITAQYLSAYPNNKKKIYFIQGYENWSLGEKELEATFALPFNKIVVSKWLHQLLLLKGFNSTIVRNGFDTKEYQITIPIENKHRSKISVLYHPNPIKGFYLALEALEMVYQKHSEIEVEAFGAEQPNFPLPPWITFHLSPSPQEHLRINNEAGIYVAASFSEGWGLTIGEAMMCGQAIACTDTKGYLEMAIHDSNALVSPTGDAKALASNVIRLINDDNLRCKIAHQGLIDIKAFDIEKSYKAFKSVIGELPQNV